MTKKRLFIFLGFVAAIVLATWYVFLYDPVSARSYRLARAAVERVEMGMTRAEAESTLSDALLHKSQQRGDWTKHLFFYGTLKVLDTTALGVHTEQIEGREVVTNYYLVPRYDLCGGHGICSDNDLAPAPGK